MADPPVIPELVIEAKARWKLAVTFFFDGLFLVFWVAVNHYANSFIDRHAPEGLDLAFLRCLQCLFGLIILAPVCVWFVKDLRIAIIRAKVEIALEQANADLRRMRAAQTASAVAAPDSGSSEATPEAIVALETEGSEGSP